MLTAPHTRAMNASVRACLSFQPSQLTTVCIAQTEKPCVGWNPTEAAVTQGPNGAPAARVTRKRENVHSVAYLYCLHLAINYKGKIDTSLAAARRGQRNALPE